jgi:prepilin-type N-terminal cleavage/methylation domain-containing protein
MIISPKLYDFSAATIVEKEVSNMSQLMKKVAKGFTLIELMIVVAIIGILAAIAIPKFADLVTKSKEASIKGSLGTIRSAVSIYYSDQEGVYPASGSLAIALTWLALPAGNALRSDSPGRLRAQPRQHGDHR